LEHGVPAGSSVGGVVAAGGDDVVSTLVMADAARQSVMDILAFSEHVNAFVTTHSSDDGSRMDVEGCAPSERDADSPLGYLLRFIPAAHAASTSGATGAPLLTPTVTTSENLRRLALAVLQVWA
jgi:hypothetical protein